MERIGTRVIFGIGTRTLHGNLVQQSDHPGFWAASRRALVRFPEAAGNRHLSCCPLPASHAGRPWGLLYLLIVVDLGSDELGERRIGQPEGVGKVQLAANADVVRIAALS